MKNPDNCEHINTEIYAPMQDENITHCADCDMIFIKAAYPLQYLNVNFDATDVGASPAAPGHTP